MFCIPLYSPTSVSKVAYKPTTVHFDGLVIWLNNNLLSCSWRITWWQCIHWNYYTHLRILKCVRNDGYINSDSKTNGITDRWMVGISTSVPCDPLDDNINCSMNSPDCHCHYMPLFRSNMIFKFTTTKFKTSWK